MSASQGLAVADVVNVTINISPIAAPFRNFGLPMFLASDDVIDVSERSRLYSGSDGVLADFGSASPVSQAALLYFSQTPQPDQVAVGRWAQTATAGVLHGSIQTPSQQLVSNFNTVTSGSAFFLVDGVPYAVSGLNFSAATNLNGVAATVQTALQAAGSTATVYWDSGLARFNVRSGTTGLQSTLGYVQSPTAVGAVNFSAQPVPGSSVTLNGTAVVFGNLAGQVPLGANLAATLANLAIFVNTSTDPQVSKFTAKASSPTLALWADTAGPSGNALTLSVSSSPASNAAVSGATLTGAVGSDVSVLLGLSSVRNLTGAAATPPVNGVAAETLTQALQYFAGYGSAYGFAVATATPPSVSDYLTAAAFVEGAQLSHVLGITTQDTSVLDPTSTQDIAYLLKSLGYKRTFTQYSSSSPYAACSIFGRAFTVDFSGVNTAITLKFKQEPGVVAEYLTESQAAALKAKNCNAFVYYQNGTAILQEGVMANGYYFDEVHGTDWLQNYLQTNLFNVLYESPTKVPQTDEGVNELVASVNDSLSQSVTNGIAAPGRWNLAGFGRLKTGDTLPNGFYVDAGRVDDQPQATRERRVAPPILVALKLAGAIHFAGVTVQANR